MMTALVLMAVVVAMGQFGGNGKLPKGHVEGFYG
jgi:hypothetical protein